MDFHPNDNAREAHPSIWIFSGSSVGWLVVGVMTSLCLLTLLSRTGVDWPPTIAISLTPLAMVTLFVQFFVNGRAPSYATDLLIYYVWKLRVWLYLRGLLSTPPPFGIHTWPKPKHPKEYGKDQ